MQISIHPNKDEMAQAAASEAAGRLKQAIAQKGSATFIAATGASQLGFLAALTSDPEIDWPKTTMFHLDEYIGLPESHPASFHQVLEEHLIGRVHPGVVHIIRGNVPDAESECRRLGELLVDVEIDVAFVGIGENGHLAFNDPPADFETEEAFIVVNLDEACRLQQVGEGWFDSLLDVPDRAISMSIMQIMRSKTIICTVPDHRKAQAVRDCFSGRVSPMHPASILQLHKNASVHLDVEAASLLVDPPSGAHEKTAANPFSNG